MKANFYTKSSLIHTGEIVALEFCPSNGVMEVRFHAGMSASDPEVYRVRTKEVSEFRNFPDEFNLDGPTYLEFFLGEGAVTIFKKA